MYPGLMGLEDAIIMAQEADKAFMTLSADVRARFKNDPVD